MSAPRPGDDGDRLLLALFFFSGLASLVMQVLWLRGFGIVLGSTVYAMSCVVTAFMVGLSAGSLAARPLLARLRWPERRPLLAYGVVELAAALGGFVVSWGLFRHTDALIGLVGLVTGPVPQATVAAHFAVVLATIFVPTFFLGLSFPAAARAVSDPSLWPRLYGVNTAGAAVGSLVASFVLIAWWGCVAAAAFALGVGGLVFVAACLGDRRLPRRDGAELPVPAGTLAPSRTPDEKLALPLAVLSGFAVFTAEIAWHRHLSFFLGNRVYVSSVTLFLLLYLLGIAARQCHRWVPRYGALRLTALAAALGVASLAVGLHYQAPALQSVFLESGGLNLSSVVLFLVLGIVVPALAMGITFPAALSLLRHDRRGARVGWLYGVNTLAGVAGSLAAGYWEVRAIGSNGAMAVAAAALLAIGVVATTGVARRNRPSAMTCSYALAGAAALFVFVLLPAAMRPLRLLAPERVLVSKEDEHGLFTIAHGPKGTLRVLNNTTELAFLFGDTRTQFVQESQAFLPMLFARRWDRLLNIGIGYGITAGAMTQLPEAGRIDAVEIVPLVVLEAERFASHNYRYTRDPRMNVTIADGRHWLALSKERYDVISVNVSDPYLPGSASLFSREFYRLAKSRLAPGGTFCQHLFGPDLVSLYQNVASQFRYTRLLRSYGNGVTFIGSDDELVPRHQADFERHVANDGLFANIPVRSVDEFLRLVRDGDRIAAELAAGRARLVNSDEHPELEFASLGDLRSFLQSNY